MNENEIMKWLKNNLELEVKREPVYADYSCVDIVVRLKNKNTNEIILSGRTTLEYNN